MTSRTFIDFPERMSWLPHDDRGFPVPRFVQWFVVVNGKPVASQFGTGTPDFRVMDSRHLQACMAKNLCWLCGGTLGRYKAFVVGPMCAVNRINSEPPSHYDCARFAARNCPFLTRPLAKRNERDLPVENRSVGLPIDRNPGCCGIWVTTSYKPFQAQVGGSGLLFELGPPERLEFWCQGQPATRTEVEASVGSGLPFLLDTATRFDGPEGIKELERQVLVFRALLDAQEWPQEAAA